MANRVAESSLVPLEALLGRIAARDEAALGDLYDATSRRVYGLALRILGDPGPAEEVTLDVYTHVWHRAATYDGARGGVDTWLRALTRSRAIDALRSRVRHESRLEALEAQAAFEDERSDPERAALESEEAGRVRRALRELPATQRQAIAAAYFRGLSYREVAEAFGLPAGTVKTRIRAGLSALRSALAEEATPS